MANIIVKRPDPTLAIKDIDKRVIQALRGLGKASKGKYAERTGVSERTLDRLNMR